jgi:hypothetical protein
MKDEQITSTRPFDAIGELRLISFEKFNENVKSRFTGSWTVLFLFTILKALPIFALEG